MRNSILKALKTAAFGLFASAVTVGASQAAGLMTVKGGYEPALQIRSHHVSATIEAGYAITQVDQVFSNPHQQDLEATYHFPVPDKAAVSEFTVWIDGQPVIGEVLEKQAAQTVYEEEKAAGRETGITSQNRHYNFEIKVSPVRAAQDTRIRLVYMQPVDMDTGIGRYVYPLEDGRTDDNALGFWSSDTAVQEDFSFKLNLRSGYPVAGMRVPAHPQASITQTNSQEWQVTLGQQSGSPNATGVVSNSIDEDSAALDALQEAGVASTRNTTGPVASLDKDIVAYWRLTSGLPGAVDLVTHREPESERGTFMLTLTPGDDLAKITEGRDWMFVLDMSGSMAGKYHTLTNGVKRALSTLNVEDRFRIVRFNNRAMELTRGWVNSTPENVNYWSNELAATQTGGGTDLFAGTQMGLKALDADRTSAIILVTDGEANVGTTAKEHFLKLMKKYDVRLFTAVMGNGANRPLLEAMTEVSNGFAVSVSNSDDIVGKLLEFTSKATHEALHNVKLDIKGVKTTDWAPAVTNTLYRGEQLIVLGHYWGSGEAQVNLSAKVSGQPREYKTRFDFPAGNTTHPEIERLLAYARIQELQNRMDYLGTDGEYKNAVIDIAVENGLVTENTSMVVMRDEQFEARGIERRNRDRRATETAAAEARSAAQVTSQRVDTAQPTFSKPRASYGSGSNNGSGSGSTGGGALLYELLLLIPFVGMMLLLRRKLWAKS